MDRKDKIEITFICISVFYIIISAIFTYLLNSKIHGIFFAAIAMCFFLFGIMFPALHQYVNTKKQDSKKTDE